MIRKAVEILFEFINEGVDGRTLSISERTGLDLASRFANAGIPPQEGASILRNIRVTEGKTEKDLEGLLSKALENRHYQTVVSIDSFEAVVRDVEFGIEKEENFSDPWDEEFPIKGASYKRRLEFFGESPRNRFFGVELELDDAGEDDDGARTVIAAGGEQHLHAMHDGSLVHGFEIVSQPMTIDYHLESMGWEQVLSEANELGYTSSNDTCGMHVHMSRLGFGETEDEQDLGISKVLLFFERNWRDIVTFSRRTPLELSKWAKSYGGGGSEEAFEPEGLLKRAKDRSKERDGKYHALNLKNYSTLEVRVFKGTLDLEQFVANLQFCDMLYKVAELPLREVLSLDWMSFASMAREEGYDELALIWQVGDVR